MLEKLTQPISSRASIRIDYFRPDIVDCTVLHKSFSFSIEPLNDSIKKQYRIKETYNGQKAKKLSNNTWAQVLRTELIKLDFILKLYFKCNILKLPTKFFLITPSKTKSGCFAWCLSVCVSVCFSVCYWLTHKVTIWFLCYLVERPSKTR